MSKARRTFKVGRLQVPSVGVAGAVLAIVLVALAILPTRTWINQRQEAERVRAELEQVEAENEALAKQREQLETPAEVERRAREDYGYVYPGEEQYVIEPGEQETSTG